MKKLLMLASLSLAAMISGAAQATLIYVNDTESTFDGSSSFSAGYDPAYSLQSPFSVAATFTITSSVNDWVRVVGRGNSGPRNYGLWYHQEANRLLFQGYGAGGFNAQYFGAVDFNTEYSLVGVLNGGVAKLFVNGVELASAASTGSLNVDTQPLTIGGASFHAIHRGTISDVGLWNTALSAGEVSDYARTGLTSFVPAPATMALFGLGLAGLGFTRRKKA